MAWYCVYCNRGMYEPAMHFLLHAINGRKHHDVRRCLSSGARELAFVSNNRLFNIKIALDHT